MTESPTKSDTTTRAGKPRRSRWSRARRWALAASALIAASAFMVSRLGIVDSFALAQLEGALGCHASAKNVTISLLGRLKFYELELRAPGVDGPAALFFTAPEVEVTPVWRSLLTSAPRLERVNLRGPVLRVCQDENLGLNIGGLRAGGAGASGALAPEIDIAGGTVELGEFGQGWYSPLAMLKLHGKLAKDAAHSTRYTVELFETRDPNTSGGASGDSDAGRLRLEGEVDLADLSTRLKLGNVDLARFTQMQAPSRIQPLWRQMELAGRLSNAEFSYSRDAGVSATFQLEQMDLNVPLPAEPMDPDSTEVASATSELLRMRGVTGEIRFDGVGLHADLTGRIEDLACHVTVETKGLTLDAPMVATIEAADFRLEDRPRLLPFAPWYVKKNFQRFSGPTAVVSGEVRIERAAAEPGATGGGAVTAQGSLRFSHGAARFDRFAYPFQEMAGEIVFDQEKVEIREITGVGPTGARLRANGLVSPPNNNAGVRIDIEATNVPSDAVLYEAIPENRRNIYDALFSDEALAELSSAGTFNSGAWADEARVRERGLEQAIERSRQAGESEASRTGLREELQKLRAQMALPSFAIGGTSSIRVVVTREEGPDHEYYTDVQVAIPRAGLLPGDFAYPVYANDFSLHITDFGATAKSPSLEGLSGAVGEMEAKIAFRPDGSDEVSISVRAGNAPMDSHLIAALARRDTRMGIGGDATPMFAGLSASRLANELGLSGTGSCNAHIAVNGAGEASYQVDVVFDRVVAKPRNGELKLTDLSGALRVTERGIRLRDLRARLGECVVTGDCAVDGLERGIAGSAVSMVGVVELTDLELSERVEDLVHAVAPEHSETLRSLRQAHLPTGLIDASLALGVANGALEYRVELANPRTLAFDVFGGRLSIEDSSGRFSIGHDAVRCEDFSAAVAFESEPAGRLSLDGVWPMRMDVAPKDGPLGGEDPDVLGELAIDLTGGQFGSPIVRAFAARVEPRASQWMSSVDLRGKFNASGTAHTTRSRGAFFVGALAPQTLGLTRDGVACEFAEALGRVTFGPDGGRVESVAARADGWSLTAEGQWESQPDISMDLEFSVETIGLPESLLAVLPSAVRSARDAMDLKVQGAVSVPDGRLRIAPPIGNMPRELRIEMGARFGRTTGQLGAMVSCGDGTATLDVRAPLDGAGTAEFELELKTDSMNVGGLHTTNVLAQFASGTAPGVFVLDWARADCHGGNVTIEGSMSTPAQGNPAVYELDLRAASVDFGALLEDLAAPKKSEAADESEELEEVDAPITGARGVFDGWVGLAGEVGRDSSRRGRGAIRVEHGEVMALPGLTGLLRLSNLQPPIGEPLEAALAVFHLQGHMVTVEQAEVSSDSLRIVGEGTIALPSLELDLRFNSQGQTGIPILSDLIRGLRDEIVTTEMTGTLHNPESRIVQLPATRRMLGTIFRGTAKREAHVVSPAPQTAK